MKHRVLPILKLLSAFALLALVVFSAQAKNKKAEASATRRELKFSHSFHVDQGVTCDQCHVNAATSATGSDDLLPGHTQCGQCHDVQAVTDCNKCHLSQAPKVSERITAYSPKFSHARHLGPGKLTCATCHTNLDSELRPHQVGHIPDMAACVSCHEQRAVKSECGTCHLPTDQLVPADHALNWINRHGIAAASLRDERCMMCHNTNQTVAMDCNRCHNGDQITSPHPRDYIGRHGPEAHLSDVQCSVCHEPSYCNDCHSRQHLIPPGHFRANWAIPNQGGEHSTQAEFDLESCMSCHQQPAQTCGSRNGCHGK